MAAASHPLPPSHRFAGYEILAEIDADRGTVRYRALQLAIGREVVLNVLPAETARNPTRAAFFRRRMNVLKTLRHENVVGAIDAGEFEGDRYFVTEYVAGATLHAALVGTPVWDVRRALGIARDVANALVHLESLHLVHRELSPRVIVLSESGTARLVDFRNAKFLVPDAEETWSDPTVNLALYTAPECVRGDRSVDSRGDIYSLGSVLYHLVTGRPPFFARNVAVLLDQQRTRRPRDPRWLKPDLPKPVVEILDGCLRKPREARYPTAAALLADLDAVIAGRKPVGSTAPGSAWERPYTGK